MDAQQITKLIGAGESQEVELKTSFPGREKLARNICALANTIGGTIIIGVSPGGEIVGLTGDLDDLQRKVSAASQDVKSPPLISQKMYVLDGKHILAITVHKASDGNFYTFQGVIYVRAGTSIQKLDGLTMLEYLRNRHILCFDESVSDAKLDDIDVVKVRKFLELRKQTHYLETHSIKDFLLSLRLATDNGNLKIKNAAVLFYSKNPTYFIPQAEVKLVKFSGTEAVDILAYKLVQSDVVNQIESSIAFIKQNLSKQLKLTGESAQREEIYEYPLSVIREAIVNAVAHRDYFSRDAIQVNIFDDHMEIISPGTLPAALSPEKFGMQSVQRNSITYHLLRDYNYVEGLGTGVPRMINGMRKAGLKDPVFDYSGCFFRVVLTNMKAALKPIEELKDLNPRQIKAIEYLRQNGTIKSEVYAKINSVSIPTAIKDIHELLRFKYLKKKGTYRGAYYILNEEKFN
ncbi:MAG: RNA-binding domain-containing protein [Candidatus Altiarchaeia archaeon]